MLLSHLPPDHLIFTLEKELISIYEAIGARYSRIQSEARLPCEKGCGECCLNPGVSATPLEMLPLALNLLRQGGGEEWLVKTREELNSFPTCFFYKPKSLDGKKGACSIYLERPILCRIFGAYLRQGKEGKPEWSICKKIKTENPEQVQKLERETYNIPDWYDFPHVWKMKIYGLAPHLAQTELPINLALWEIFQWIYLACCGRK